MISNIQHLKYDEIYLQIKEQMCKWCRGEYNSLKILLWWIVLLVALGLTELTSNIYKQMTMASNLQFLLLLQLAVSSLLPGYRPPPSPEGRR